MMHTVQDMMWWGSGWGWMPILGWLVMIALVGVILWALLGRPDARSSSRLETEDPLHILKVRYAKGEISREDYERMKEELR